MSDYTPPSGLRVKIDLGESGYSAPNGIRVTINLTPEQGGGGAEQYVGGEGWGIASLNFGHSSVRLAQVHISYVTLGDLSRYGTPRILNQQSLIKPNALPATLYGRPALLSLRSYIIGSGLSAFTSGKPRVSYKEQHAITRQEKESTLWGKLLVAHGVRYVEQNSPLPLTRFGTAWASFSPRFIEPRGIFQQFPSYHRIGGSQTVKMEGFDFLRFGTRIIPESQSIRPDGFSTLFGDAEIYNYVQHIKPKGFLTVGEKLDLRWGQQKVFNNTQYILPFHTDQDKTTGAWAYKDYWTEEPLEILNRNRTIQTHGRLSTVFGYADLTNKARVISPVGIPSPLEVELTKTLVADGIRYIKPGSIEAPYFSSWNSIWLGAQVKAIQGPVFSQYGMPHVENTRRIYRFISLGEQTLFGKGMISHAVRGIRIQENYGIAPPVIPMPEVKLGVRYVESRSIDSVRYGWPYVTEQFTKIAPRWVYIDRVGEPVIKNVTPQVRPWQFESAEYGTAYIGLYTRHIKPSGLNAQGFGSFRISDRKQGVDLRNYGIQPPTITKLHKVENIGAGQLLPHVIYPRPITTTNFETQSDKLHKVRQNVIRQESKDPMTRFGDTSIHANSIRVEPGYWEILMGKPLVEYKNRKIHIDSTSCDFLGISKPRMSPHTIWAVVEAPIQARANHVSPYLPPHYVDGRTESGNTKYPGIEIGTPRISHKNRRLNPPGYLAFGIGKPMIYNVVSKIEPKGWASLRLGVLGPIGDQHIIFRPKDPMTQWGKLGIQRVVRYDGKLKPAGLFLEKSGVPIIDFYHRAIKPVGLHSLTMGTRKVDDKPYMWQGLRVGVHVPIRIGDLDALKFGSTWISCRVREAVVNGSDFAVVNEYEPGKFNLKMTIKNAKQPEYPRAQQVIMKGFVAELVGSPDVKLKLHFIRPYGNSDNFRKGGL